MRGHFEGLIGKTITGVYCRENNNTPYGQIFLLFDDNTYFEIYANGALRGAGGIDKGDMETVLNLNFTDGKGEVFK